MAPVTVEEEYRAHRGAVFGALAARHRELGVDQREELYNEAWTSVLKRRCEGVEIGDLRSYLVGAAANLAAKRVYGADARRRVSFDPLSSPFLALADRSSSLEERVLADDEARRVRMMIDELDGVERSVLKLRLDLALEPREIREHLGLTERQYRRAAERAGKALVRQFALFESDAWERRRRSLLCACLMGIASERQQEKARRLLAEDPYARALLGELRELGDRAAAVLPLPGVVVGASDAGGGRLGELVAAAREQVSELFAGAKGNAISAAHRVLDPTPLAGARPGAVAAAVAGCIAAGGGAYCAVEGVPDPLRSPLGIEQRAEADEAPRADDPVADAGPTVDPAPASPAPPEQTAGAPAAPPASEPAAEPSPPPPPPPAQEFGPAPAGGAEPTAGAAGGETPAPAPSPPRTKQTQSPAGEFGP